MNIVWKHPFMCVIAGPTGCGKTIWVKQFLGKLNEIVHPLPQEVIWCYGEWQDGYNGMKDITFIEGWIFGGVWMMVRRTQIVIS